MADQPKPTIKCASVTEGSSKDCIKALIEKIKDLKLTKENIINISLHDSKVRHGDLEAVVFYNTKPSPASFKPLGDDLTYNLIERDEDTNWDDIMRELLVNTNQESKQNLAIGATFRHVGDEKIACTFSVPGVKRELTEKKFSARGSWISVIDQAKKFLNEYIIPADLHSVALFEEEHPLFERESEFGTRNVIVYHYAGDNEGLTPIKEQKPEFDSQIYGYTLLEKGEQEDWSKMYQDIEENLEKLGQIDGVFIATATSSDDKNNGYQLALIVRTDPAAAQALADLGREGGCCSIF